MRVKTKFWITLGTDAVSWWAGWAGWTLAHQEFGSSLNPGAPVAMWTCPLQVLAAILTLSQQARLWLSKFGVDTRIGWA